MLFFDAMHRADSRPVQSKTKSTDMALLEMHYRIVDNDALSFGIERRDDQTHQTVPLHDPSLKIEENG